LHPTLNLPIVPNLPNSAVESMAFCWATPARLFVHPRQLPHPFRPVLSKVVGPRSDRATCSQACKGPERGAQPLMEAGLDSLGATELQASLGAAFGLQLPATATIDHPTSAALAAYIGALLGDTPASQRALPSSVPCSFTYQIT